MSAARPLASGTDPVSPSPSDALRADSPSRPSRLSEPRSAARVVASRVAFAIVTASLLLAEITLTRVFSGTIGYYFAFMSISIAMLGLGAGSLWVTLRGALPIHPDARAGRAALTLAFVGAASALAYLRYYPAMGATGGAGQVAEILVFGALFAPFLVGGVLVATVFEANRRTFATLYAIDLLGAAAGCVAAVFLLNRVAAPRALLVLAVVAGAAAPLFYYAAARARHAVVALLLVAALGGGVFAIRRSELFALPMIRNQTVHGIALDRWNDFSRVVVKWGLFCTWGLSETYPERHDKQFDLMIEGVAGTQIQSFDGRDVSKLDFLASDLSSLPHWVRPTGSTLALGVGGGFDVLMAKYFHKAPVVGVEVNPLVGDIVNNDFAGWSGRPYYLPDVTVHFENARTFVKRDTARYDVVTVTWVDSGAATGAGAFALTENYLYTVEAFQDYLARLKDDGVLSFLRARYDPEYDAIKGVGVLVEAMRRMGVTNPAEHIVITSVASPHFLRREMTLVMAKARPFTAAEIGRIDAVRARLHFKDLYTPGRSTNDRDMARLVEGTDRAAVYASFPFDMEPNTDDRPFYFFLRALPGREAGHDVQVLRQSLVTILVLIGVFLAVPLAVLRWRHRDAASRATSLVAPSIYFALLGLGFMLIEMKLLQQSGLIVGNPTLSLVAVLAGLLLSSGLGALFSQRIAPAGDRRRGAWLFVSLLAVLVLALIGSETIADRLTALPLAARTAGMVLAISPIGFLLGCPLPLGMASLARASGEGEASSDGTVAWCWGVNGMFSVAGSAVAVYLAIHMGLRVAFLAGVACYVVAGAIWLGWSRPRSGRFARGITDGI